jgi:hypothetical protein
MKISAQTARCSLTSSESHGESSLNIGKWTIAMWSCAPKS